jgi:hypothetical protein
LPHRPTAGSLPASPRLRKFFQSLFVILACLQLAGGPYPLIQGYAWATMLASYSQEKGIVRAAQDTFSGEKPCDICHWIAKNRQPNPDGTPEPLTPSRSILTLKLLQDMLPASIAGTRPPPGRDLETAEFAAPPPASPHGQAAPPVPPPRAIA